MGNLVVGVVDSLIDGHVGCGIRAGHFGSVRIRSSTISNNDFCGVNTPAGLERVVKTRIKDSVITGNGGDGVNVWQTVIVSNSMISNNDGNGIYKDFSDDSSTARIRKSTITGNTIGVTSFNPMDMTDTTVTAPMLAAAPPSNAATSPAGMRLQSVRARPAVQATCSAQVYPERAGAYANWIRRIERHDRRPAQSSPHRISLETRHRPDMTRVRSFGSTRSTQAATFQGHGHATASAPPPRRVRVATVLS